MMLQWPLQEGAYFWNRKCKDWSWRETVQGNLLKHFGDYMGTVPKTWVTSWKNPYQRRTCFSCFSHAGLTLGCLMFLGMMSSSWRQQTGKCCFCRNSIRKHAKKGGRISTHACGCLNRESYRSSLQGHAIMCVLYSRCHFCERCPVLQHGAIFLFPIAGPPATSLQQGCQVATALSSFGRSLQIHCWLQVPSSLEAQGGFPCVATEALRLVSSNLVETRQGDGFAQLGRHRSANATRPGSEVRLPLNHKWLPHHATSRACN